jgi:hypothetical protein
MSKLWTPRREEYYIRCGSMFENPHGVPRDEIIQMIVDNPPEVVAQVVFGKYVESSGLVFTGELVHQMIDYELPVVRGESYLAPGAVKEAADFRHHLRDWGQRYHTGIDFARQTDHTVISTLDTSTRPARLVYWKRLNRVAWESIYAEVGRAILMFGPNVLCDSTGPGGDSAMDALENRLYCPVHHRTLLSDTPFCVDEDGFPRVECRKTVISLGSCEGFHFTGVSKKDIVDHLRICLSVGQNPLDRDEPFGWIRTPPIPQLEEELVFYTWDDKKLETDCLFSLALAAWSGLDDPVGDPVAGDPYGV